VRVSLFVARENGVLIKGRAIKPHLQPVENLELSLGEVEPRYTSLYYPRYVPHLQPVEHLELGFGEVEPLLRVVIVEHMVLLCLLVVGPELAGEPVRLLACAFPARCSGGERGCKSVY